MESAQAAILLPQFPTEGPLAALMPTMLNALNHSRAESTMTKYAHHLRAYHEFCDTHQLVAVPAALPTVMFYLTHLLVRAESQGQTASVLTGPRDAISTLHQLCGVASPTSHSLVKQLLEGASRLLAHPIRKRAPLTIAHLAQLASRYTGLLASLEDLMITTAMSVGFFGFFRYSDLAAITADHVSFRQNHIVVFLPGRKNDQHRRGSSISIAACPGKPYCPVALLVQLFGRAKLFGTANPVFMVVTAGRPTALPLDYNRCRRLFKKQFLSIGLNPRLFGTHSLRAGGATLAAQCNVPEANWMAHGGWRSTTAARGYIRPTDSARLAVTRTLAAPPCLPPAASSQPDPPPPALNLPPRPRSRRARASPARSPCVPASQPVLSGRSRLIKRPPRFLT